MKLTDLSAICLAIVLLCIWGIFMGGHTICIFIAWTKSMIHSGVARFKKFAVKDGEWRY